MFIDANVFINAYIAKDFAGEKAMALLKRIKSGEQNAATSPMVLDETVYIIAKNRGIEFALRTHKNTLNISNLQILPINKRTCESLPEIIFETDLEPHDAFNIAVMRENNISTICSFDRDFDKIKGIKRVEPK